MSMIDDNFIEDVKARINILDIISSYVELKGNAESYKGLCPFHNEKSPSFMVNEKKQIFKCFGCGEGGDAIAFIMKKENLDFMDALKVLAEKANIPWPEDKTITVQQRQTAELREKLLQIHLIAARYYFQMLWNNVDKSLDYIKRRNLSDKTIKKFGLGYAPRSTALREHLLSKGYIEKELIESGLFVSRGTQIKDRFFGRIMFPIFDIRGRVIAFGGRVIDSSLPKYLNSSDTLIFHKKNHLYGLNIAKNNLTRDIFLVEGYMDVIAMHQYGFSSAVASLGTSLTEQQAQSIKKYCNNVYLAYDNDEAGIKATLRGIDILKNNELSAFVLDFSPWNDPDEYLSNNSTEEFEKIISNSKSSLQFQIEQIQKKYSLDMEKDKVTFIKEASFVLKKHSSPVEIETEIIRLSDITGLSIKSIGSEVYGKYFSPKQFETQRMKKSSKFTEKNDIKIHKDEEAWLITEFSFLNYLVNHISEYDVIKNMLSKDDFSNEESREIFDMLSDKNLSDVVKEKFKGKNIKYEVISSEQIYNLMLIIKKNSLKMKINHLLEEQKKLDSSNEKDQRRLIEIGMSVMEFTKELDNL